MGTDAANIDQKYSELGPKVREMLRNEAPRRQVKVAAFSMDRCEVTNRQFQKFVEASPQWRRTRIEPRFHNGDYLKHWEGDHCPPELADHPVVYVSWYAAAAFAGWSGKRLPAESEWEYAARGALRDAEYPWGNEPPSPTRANFAASDLGRTRAVGQYPPNGFGLYDMAGNVWEYCANEWQPNAETARRVIRGGSWGGAPVNLRVAFRDSHPATGAGPHVGFRCARSPVHRRL